MFGRNVWEPKTSKKAAVSIVDSMFWYGISTRVTVVSLALTYYPSHVYVCSLAS